VVSPGEDLQQALRDLKPGVTLVVRGRHELNGTKLRFGRKCSAKAPCNIIGEDGTLDGSVDLNLKWTLVDAKKNQWEAKVSRTIWQLWMNGDPLTVARVPNVDVWSKDYFDKKKSFLWAPGSGASNWIEGSKPQLGKETIPDSAEQNLEGCVMVINSGAWLSYGRVITKHTGRRVEFESVGKPMPTRNTKTMKSSLIGLYFECGTLLDSPNEWWFDRDPQGAFQGLTSQTSSGTVTLQLPEGVTPHGKEFRGRIQDTLISLQNAQNVNVRNLNFFAGSMKLEGSKHVTVEGCKFLYPHHSKRVLKRRTDGGLIDAGAAGNLQFRNNVVRYSDGALMTMRNSFGCHVENNEFYMIDQAVTGGNGGTTIDALNSKDFVYRYNTLDYAGSSDNIRYSVVGVTDQIGAEASMNYHSHCGTSQIDGATIQIAAGSGPWNNYVHHNWFVNTVRGGMRFDGWEAGVCGIVDHNVAYNTGAWGFRIKGDYHKVVANTDLSSTLKTTGPSLDKGPAPAGGKGNGNSWVRNNAAYFGSYKGKHVGDTSHNYNSKRIKDLLVDPEGFDFRPKAGENPLVDAGEVIKEIKLCGNNLSWGSYYKDAKKLLVDASYVGTAPDIGAYERGADSYWLPGRRSEVPSHPIPQTAGSVRTDLIWRPACGQFPECLDDELAGIKAYHVMAGCQQSDDTKVDMKEIATTRTNLLVSPWLFAFNTPCFWRVDTELTTGKTRQGEMWNYRATWQNCSVEYIPCSATMTSKNNGEVSTAFTTGKDFFGQDVTAHSLRTHSTYFMKCTIPESAMKKQGPLGGRWLEPRISLPGGAHLFPVSDAPASWEAKDTTGKTPWVVAAEKTMAGAKKKVKAPKGVPLPQYRKSCGRGSGSTSLTGNKVAQACVRGTTSVASKLSYCESYAEYFKNMKSGAIFRSRKRCEEDYITGPGTYTFALKARKSTIPAKGPGVPSIGLMVCRP